MKYSEYQVWFHAFNNAVSVFSKRDDHYSVKNVIGSSEQVASYALRKFKEVDMPSVPELGLQDIVNKIIDKESISRK